MKVRGSCPKCRTVIEAEIIPVRIAYGSISRWERIFDGLFRRAWAKFDEGYAIMSRAFREIER